MRRRSKSLRPAYNWIVAAGTTLCLSTALTVAADLGPLSPATVRDALAVNIHFTTPRPGEMDLLADLGVGRVRMDISWQSVEREKGVYDFGRFEELLSQLDARHIRAMLILDYGNTLYTGGNQAAPITPDARIAFSRYAAATVGHFKGRGVLWEIYNEPNNSEFWKPAPNAGAYAALVVETAKAVRAVAPDETLCGPGLAGIDRKYLDVMLTAGVLKDLDAVTVHPYRKTDPETFAVELDALRHAVSDHAPAGKAVPVLASEWGYPVVWVDATTQVNDLARQMLWGLSERMPLNVWYDWRRGGTYEGKLAIFGLIDATPDGHGGMGLKTTPLYDAFAALTRMLGETRFIERRPAETANAPSDYLLAFEGPSGRRYAAWCTTPMREAKIAVPDGTYDLYDVWGKSLGRRDAHGGLEFRLSNSPIYLVHTSAPSTTKKANP